MSRSNQSPEFSDSPTPAPPSAKRDPIRPAAAWRILTESGSRYTVALDADGGWWFAGANVPNPFSVELPPGFWAIEPPVPWPPVLGSPIHLAALHSLELDDPRRVPGGGKNTSDVRAVLSLDLAAGEL